MTPQETLVRAVYALGYVEPESARKGMSRLFERELRILRNEIPEAPRRRTPFTKADIGVLQLAKDVIAGEPS